MIMGRLAFERYCINAAMMANLNPIILFSGEAVVHCLYEKQITELYSHNILNCAKNVAQLF